MNEYSYRKLTGALLWHFSMVVSHFIVNNGDQEKNKPTFIELIKVSINGYNHCSSLSNLRVTQYVPQRGLLSASASICTLKYNSRVFDSENLGDCFSDY